MRYILKDSFKLLMCTALLTGCIKGLVLRQVASSELKYFKSSGAMVGYMGMGLKIVCGGGTLSCALKA